MSNQGAWWHLETETMADDLLPTFHGGRGGSGCENPDCGASNRHIRVLSTHEVNLVFPSKTDLEYWPLPPQATHVCSKCGYIYSGYEDNFVTDHDSDYLSDRPDVDLSEYDWDKQVVFETTVRDAAEQLVAGAPDSADYDELAEAIERHIPGLGRSDADTILEASDRDVTVHNAADYM